MVDTLIGRVHWFLISFSSNEFVDMVVTKLVKKIGLLPYDEGAEKVRT